MHACDRWLHRYAAYDTCPRPPPPGAARVVLPPASHHFIRPFIIILLLYSLTICCQWLVFVYLYVYGYLHA